VSKNPPASKSRRAFAARAFSTLLRLLLVLFVVVPAIVGLYAIARPVEAERDWIGIQRYWRVTLASFGIPLPGTPALYDVERRLQAHGVAVGDPILMRIFKREFELELWMMRDGRFLKFATYPICKWSGELGPKLKTGDRQAPEGFYTVDKQALNPNSAWHRSFNLGFPNTFDRAHGRTGSFLMVHGACASVGCYAMTDAQMTEIWTVVTAALDAGQPAFQVQAYPFRMTPKNLAAYRGHPHADFWADLAAGHDLFEQTGLPPSASVCGGRYIFEAGRSVTSATSLPVRCNQAAAKN